MTHLRKMMLEELERRNYSESTIRAYVRTIEDLARYFKRPPDQRNSNVVGTARPLASLSSGYTSKIHG